MSNQSQRNLRLWLCAGLAAGVLAVYWQVVHFEFVNFDDYSHVAANPFVQDGLTLRGVVWAFTPGHSSNWHPVTWLSHMLDCGLFGLNAGMHHLMNVALHLTNVLLLFILLERLTGALWRSALVAALFALHPLHVESVAWVSERKDVLSGLFGLLTLWAYARYAQGATQGSKFKIQNYLLALLFFTLGLMSKPMLVTWPFVLLLLDFWPLRRFEPSMISHQPSSRLRLLWEKLPFFALAAGASLITFLEQRRAGAMDATTALSISDRFANAAVSYLRYLGKTFWPVDLAVLYPHPGHWPVGTVIAAGVVLLSASIAVILLARRMSWLAVGWFWFLGTLVPVIGLVQVGSQAMADRYTYLPHIGLFVAIVWTANELTKGWPFRRAMAFGISLGVLAGCLATAWSQARYWQNSVTLFDRALAVTSNNALAHYNCGQALAVRGKTREAMRHYREALRINPDHFPARLNLGSLCHESGDWTEALNHLKHAVQLRPGHVLAHYNLGLALAAVGDWPAAESNFAVTASGSTNDYELQLEWGKTLLAQQKFAAAAERIAESLRVEPRSAAAHLEMGMVLAAQLQPAAAAAHFEEALRLQPDLPETLNNRAWRLATDPDANGQHGPEAVRCALRACELTRYQQAVLVGTLAAAYARDGLFEEAKSTAAKAIALAEVSGQPELAARNRQLLEFYQAGKDYRESP